MIFNIIIFLIFIVLSAFFSASETAIFSLSNLRLRRLSERYPKARVLKNLIKRPTRLLSAIVFGNLLVNIGLASLSTAIFVGAFGKAGLMLAIFVSGILILFLGEIFPKIFAIYIADRLALIVAPVLSVFSNIFHPIILVIENVVVNLSSFIISKPRKNTLSDEDFKAALLLGKKDGQISAQEEEMISYVLEFKDTQASEILTARIDIKGISDTLSQEEVLDVLRKEKHSKFPIYKDSLDNIIGVLYTKDIFLNPDSDYHNFLKEPVFVTESKGIDDILKLFLEKNERIAIVLDEYGGTEGLITLEDIVEEIFGEIYDEFEKIEEPVEEISKGEWKVYGKASIKAVNLELSLDLPEEEDTIAGFLLSKIERIPRPKEIFYFSSQGEIRPSGGKVKLIIERASARRIISIVLEVKSKKDINSN